jgi:hypothetical protein
MTARIKLTPEERKERRKAQRRAASAAWYAKNTERRKARNATPEHKARLKVYRATPEFKARRAAYRAKPETKARLAAPKNKAQDFANRLGTPIEIPNRPRPDRCECCGAPPSDKRALHFDHCHGSGRFRGWTCILCNTGTGLADNPKRLRLRLRYLERPFQPDPIRWAYPKNWQSCGEHSYSAKGDVSCTINGTLS